MKKSTVAIIALVVVAFGGLGFALMHKSTPPINHSTSASTVAATNDAVLVTKTNSGLGQYLAEPSGQPLYTFGGDSNGVSNCMGSCLASWPAYQDNGSTTNLPAGVSTFKRMDNGETQFAYNGMPLYTFVSDNNGQVTGNGVSNFTIARPTSSSSTSPSNSPSNTNSSSSTGGDSW